MKLKFSHGLLGGVVFGFFATCSTIAIREVEQEKRLKESELKIKTTGYNRGFSDGKDFAMLYHESLHPDCGKCPH